jgi:hypothetical protein
MTKKFKQGLNRFNYRDIISKSGLEKGFERPDNNQIIQREPQEQQQIIQQQIIQQQDRNKDDLEYIAKKGDKYFDYVGRSSFGLIGLPGWLAANAGAEWIIFHSIIPSGQKMVIQQYLFFTSTLFEQPAIPYPVLTSPLEYEDDFSYKLLINGTSPIDERLWFAGPGDPNIRFRDQNFIQSIDPQRDSNPNATGIIVPIRSGSTLQVRIRKESAAATPFTFGRNPYRFYCRIRGFLTTEATARRS